jgi:hypothetical protein
MRRFREQQVVGPGWYFNPRNLHFRSIDEEKPLNGKPGEDYIKVPILVTILVAPFIGLVYFMFLPLVGFVMLISLLGKKLGGLVARAAASTVRVAAPSWQPARAFFSTSRARAKDKTDTDKWAEATAAELALESEPNGRHVRVARSVTIHAPLDTTYTVAENPDCWDDWYVGLSESRRMEKVWLDERHPNVSIGTRFPLIEADCEDSYGEGTAHWHSIGMHSVETGAEGLRGIRVLLPSEQDWTYTAHGDATEVRVEVDLRIPDEGWVKALDAETVEELETECLEQTLENLKTLCESKTVH